MESDNNANIVLKKIRKTLEAVDLNFTIFGNKIDVFKLEMKEQSDLIKSLQFQNNLLFSELRAVKKNINGEKNAKRKNP